MCVVRALVREMKKMKKKLKGNAGSFSDTFSYRDRNLKCEIEKGQPSRARRTSGKTSEIVYRGSRLGPKLSGGSQLGCTRVSSCVWWQNLLV